MDFLADDVFFYLYSICVSIDLASIRWASDSVAEIDFNWMKYKPHKNEPHAEHQSTVLYYCKKIPTTAFNLIFNSKTQCQSSTSFQEHHHTLYSDRSKLITGIFFQDIDILKSIYSHQKVY